MVLATISAQSEAPEHHCRVLAYKIPHRHQLRNLNTPLETTEEENGDEQQKADDQPFLKLTSAVCATPPT
ncbi:hypothetical protein FoTM2_009405 [Fusarium oxysporum f. sp. vasinfectum]|nr:hypothetical protein FoTM2_009405 [Fusarium oxysporum f. sp. vasinfectum]